MALPVLHVLDDDTLGRKPPSKQLQPCKLTCEDVLSQPARRLGRALYWAATLGTHPIDSDAVLQRGSVAFRAVCVILVAMPSLCIRRARCIGSKSLVFRRVAGFSHDNLGLPWYLRHQNRRRFLDMVSAVTPDTSPTSLIPIGIPSCSAATTMAVAARVRGLPVRPSRRCFARRCTFQLSASPEQNAAT